MPDGSEECGIILARLDELEKRLKSIESGFDQLERRLDTDKAFLSGAHFALARIGAVVVALFGVVGWIASGGGHSFATWLRKVLPDG